MAEATLKVTKVLGPYVDKKSGRRIVNLFYEGGEKKTTALGRWVLEQKLGRCLEKWETVDHINGDPTDDSPENLQVLTLMDNIRKSAKPRELATFTCPVCGAWAAKPARYVRHNRKQGKAGPFCGKSCAGKFRA